MRAAIRTGCGVLIAALGAGSCGGSSSETPWPVEPENGVLGPVGESSASPGVDERPPSADAGLGEAADERAEPTDAGEAAPRRLRRRP